MICNYIFVHSYICICMLWTVFPDVSARYWVLVGIGTSLAWIAKDDVTSEHLPEETALWISTVCHSMQSVYPGSLRLVFERHVQAHVEGRSVNKWLIMLLCEFISRWTGPNWCNNRRFGNHWPEACWVWGGLGGPRGVSCYAQGEVFGKDAERECENMPMTSRPRPSTSSLLRTDFHHFWATFQGGARSCSRKCIVKTCSISVICNTDN